MVYEIAEFGYNCAAVCILFHRQLSAPIRKSSSYHSCTTTRIMRALPQRHCRISIAVTQTCLQALSLLSAHNTLHSAHISTSSDCAKTYFGSHIPQILPTSERGLRSNVAFIANTLQMCCRKNGIVIYFFRGNFFNEKGQIPNEFLKANQLKMRQKKAK